MNKTKCDAIKLESNGKNFHIIQNLEKKNSCDGAYWIHTTI